MTLHETQEYPSCQFVYERIIIVAVLYKPRKSRQKFCEINMKNQTSKIEGRLLKKNEDFFWDLKNLKNSLGFFVKIPKVLWDFSAFRRISQDFLQILDIFNIFWLSQYIMRV